MKNVVGKSKIFFIVASLPYNRGCPEKLVWGYDVFRIPQANGFYKAEVSK